MHRLTRTIATATLAGATLAVPAAAHGATGEPPLTWTYRGPVGAVTDDLGHPATTARGSWDVLTVGGTTYAVMGDGRLDDPFGYRNTEVMLRTSTDGGQTWGTLRDISVDPPGSTTVSDDSGPSLAANDSSVLAVFKTKTAGTPSAAGPNKLTVVSDLAGTPTQRRIDNTWITVRAAGAGNSYYLVGMSAATWRPQVRRSTDDGQTWSPATDLGLPVCYRASDDAWPDVAASGSLVVVTISANDCTQDDQYRIVSHDGGATWDAPVRVTNTPQSEGAPRTYISGNTIVTVWRTIRSATARTVDFTRSTDGGATWSAPATAYTYDVVDWNRELAPNDIPRLSAADGHLDVYLPFTTKSVTSTDLGATWSPGTNAPNPSQVTIMQRLPGGWFAWNGPDTASWTGVYLTAPGAPRNVTASLSGRLATLTWSAPDTGDQPDSYVVRDQTGQQVATVGAEQRYATVAGLAFGTAYTFTVTAVNAAGESPGAPSNTVTTLEQPAAPRNVTASLAGRTATLTWDPPDPAGPIDGYVIRDQTGQQVWGVGPDATSATVSGLVYGVTYAFTVAAYNATGEGPAVTSNEVRPTAAPSQMSRPSASVRRHTVTVTWTAPHANGSPITGYVATSDHRQRKTTGPAARSASFSSLKPGIYRFRVAATNAVGTSIPSAWVRVRVR